MLSEMEQNCSAYTCIRIYLNKDFSRSHCRVHHGTGRDVTWLVSAQPPPLVSKWTGSCCQSLAPSQLHAVVCLLSGLRSPLHMRCLSALVQRLLGCTSLLSAGGLLAPKTFCMIYCVHFLHTETWHAPHHTHFLYSTLSCICHAPAEAFQILVEEIGPKPDFPQRISSFPL